MTYLSSDGGKENKNRNTKNRNIKNHYKWYF